jgi:hypothetical protein
MRGPDRDWGMVNLDLDDEGRIIGLEVLDARQMLRRESCRPDQAVADVSKDRPWTEHPGRHELFLMTVPQGMAHRSCRGVVVHLLG